ncbi:MAG TPA: hypothetical protein VGG62_17735 [Terracidiphilus sp.]|jgi:hypothetical protein
MYGELNTIKTTTGDEIPAIPVAIQNPFKTAAMRLPTAQEISAYTGSIRQLVRRVGRRSTEDQDVPNIDAERKLFEAIRLDKSGVEFDEAEMRYAIDLVLRHNVVDCERDGDYYAVKVATLWGVTTHACRIPTTRELQTYREGVIKSRELPRNVEERRFPPEVPTEFYDAIVTSVEGYAPQFNVPTGTVNGNRHVLTGAELKAILPQIPPHHKRSVVGEVSSALYDLDPQIDPSE